MLQIWLLIKCIKMYKTVNQRKVIENSRRVGHIQMPTENHKIIEMTLAMLRLQYICLNERRFLMQILSSLCYIGTIRRLSFRECKV